MSGTVKIAAFLTFLACAPVYAFTMPQSGHFLLEAGAYTSNNIGQSQKVFIKGTIGDSYNVTNRYDGNSVLGVGYLFDGLDRGVLGIDYGLNVFYLAKTKSVGTITQEMVFTNLGYSYYVSHLPVYAIAKAHINLNNDKVQAMTVDVGVGPNFMSASGFSDWSLDGGKTVPDNAFSNPDNVKTVFSVMAGVGLKTNVIKQFPIEVGYRFFYLGENSLKPRTNQVLNTLKKGNIYAQALMVTVSI